MKVVSVINYKGGVGKTTVTANLGAELAFRGYRVLLVDLDPQASLTLSFFRPPEWTSTWIFISRLISSGWVQLVEEDLSA